MRFLTIILALASITSTSLNAAATSPAPPGSALALLESQSDLTVVAGLIKNFPDITELYLTVQNATIFAATDDTFADTNPKSILYNTNVPYTKSILRAIIVQGVYPTTAIDTTPKYVNTELTDLRFVDTSRGFAVAKLVEKNGKKTATLGLGVDTTITTGDLKFEGGIVHKTSNPLSLPLEVYAAAGVLGLKAYTTVDPVVVSVVEILETAPDSTIFSLTNEATAANIPPPANLTANETIKVATEVIERFVISPGVYFENAFDGRTVKTISGFEVTLAGYGTGKLTVNDAVVVESDIFLRNGVVHLLDRPLIPLKKRVAAPLTQRW